MIAGHDHIARDHLARLAVVYVRQSSPGQVRENVESTRIQLGLREKATELGWDSTVVIADDLGISATGFADRPGFQELLTRVALKEVGVIFCIEAARLSRNSKDWAHLFELCGHFNTLIVDDQQIYNLCQPNDRLLLGIKGSISEMELSLLQGRLQRALVAKAARGELRLNLPAGYVYDAADKIVFDPDKRVQAAMLTMFERFRHSTSMRQLALWYRSTKTLFPCGKKAVSGETLWSIPGVNSLHNLLRHPIYAGA